MFISFDFVLLESCTFVNKLFEFYLIYFSNLPNTDIIFQTTTKYKNPKTGQHEHKKKRVRRTCFPCCTRLGAHANTNYVIALNDNNYDEIKHVEIKRK